MDPQTRRALVIGLHLQKKKPSDIVRTVGVDRKFVYRTIKRYQEKGTLEDRRRSGRPKTARTPKNIQKLEKLVRQKPTISQRKAARSLKISKDSVKTILKKDLKMKPYKFAEVHALTPSMKQQRVKRCRKLLRRFPKKRLDKIIFSDEKIFTVEQSHNHQNDRYWAVKRPGDSAIIERRQKPTSVMVWAGITASGKTPLVFIEQGVKVNQEVYQKAVLQKVLVPWARRHFGQQHWTFQQDSAPSHGATTTQTWLRSKVPDFISKEEWPANSPDLNPMDYSIWSILEAEACAVPHATRDSLIKALKKKWRTFPSAYIEKAVHDFPRRLRACIEAEGGHFEL